jgi:uncharacterized protein (DUF1810 family)
MAFIDPIKKSRFSSFPLKLARYTRHSDTDPPKDGFAVVNFRPLRTFERFHSAQATPSVGYDTALAEIRPGRKTSHWIWYIFPQIEGLGRSSTARTYAIRDLAEACEYLRDPLLRARYEEIAGAVRDQLARGRPLEDLMGRRTDALKLVSSLTLFRAAAQSLTSEDPTFESLAQLCDSLLGRTSAQGYPPCAETLARVTD